MGDFFDKFSNIPWTQKLFLLLLVLAALFIGFYTLFYNKIEEEIISRRQEQVDLSAAQARLVTLRERARQLEEDVRVEQARRTSLQVNLPTSDMIPALLEQLHETASQIPTSPGGSDLEITQVARRPYVQGPDYTRVPVELTLRATYDQLSDFCWALTRMPRLVHVKSATMRVGGGAQASYPNSPVLDIGLGIEAFFRP
ncbi:MAG: type 4a pilus biogenesis protein PilO [Bradymonadales bacterium]|nr:type 4a pilus biogenesis protein PilO [Bradymonadales bacterium]